MLHMRYIANILSHHWKFVPLVLVLVASVFVLVYVASFFGSHSEPDLLAALPTEAVSAEAPALTGETYLGLDPAILDYLEYPQPGYAVLERRLFSATTTTIGEYVPLNARSLSFDGAPTPLPTPLPFPTSPPLPLPSNQQSILPTLVPIVEGGVMRTLPYVVPGGTDCAPDGNPVQGVLTQRYHRYHSGIDIGIPLQTPVVATHSGTVTFAGWSDVGYGYLVIVQSGVYITYYAHNTSFNVVEGQQIGRNSVIAFSGSTGNSSGPHVHYETRINDVPVDPLAFSARGLGTC